MDIKWISGTDKRISEGSFERKKFTGESTCRANLFQPLDTQGGANN